jgi:hypothetical protein
MNERESDPTGAFRGGSAGLEDEGTTGTEYERHAPSGSEPGGGQPNTGSTATPANVAESQTPGVDETERDVVTSGIAATSEIADPEAQHAAEAQGDGTPLPR